MPSWLIPTLISAAVMISLALLAYLVNGLLAAGRLTGGVQEKLSELSAQAMSTQTQVAEIRKEMMRPADMKAAILELHLQFYKEMQADFFRNVQVSRVDPQSKP